MPVDSSMTHDQIGSRKRFEIKTLVLSVKHACHPRKKISIMFAGSAMKFIKLRYTFFLLINHLVLFDFYNDFWNKSEEQLVLFFWQTVTW